MWWWKKAPWWLLFSVFIQAALYLPHLPPDLPIAGSRYTLSKSIAVFVPPMAAGALLVFGGLAEKALLKPVSPNHGSNNRALLLSGVVFALIPALFLAADWLYFRQFREANTLPLDERWLSGTLAVLMASVNPTSRRAKGLGLTLWAATALWLAFAGNPRLALALSLSGLLASYWLRSRLTE